VRGGEGWKAGSQCELEETWGRGGRGGGMRGEAGEEQRREGGWCGGEGGGLRTSG